MHGQGAYLYLVCFCTVSVFSLKRKGYARLLLSDREQKEEPNIIINNKVMKPRLNE